MKPQELKLDSEIFAGLRGGIDACLNILVCQMLQKGINAGNVTARIGIEIKEFATEDGEIIREPDIKYSVSYGMSAKDNIKGDVQKGLILRRNREGKILIASEQIGMDELMDGTEEE